MGNTVVSVLGSRLDHQGLGNRRWRRWRPNISLLYQDDLVIDHFVLIYHENEQALADLTIADMHELRPEMEVTGHIVDFDNPWDFEQVYGQLHDFATSFAFDVENNDYLVQITTGTHVVQICLYLLAEANYIPARLLQVSPSKSGKQKPKGKYQIIDLDLSRYDQIAQRFEHEERHYLSYLKAGIETQNKTFNSLIKQVEQVAVLSQEPILLTGATGVGKTRLAQRIYDLKRQRSQLKGQFVEVNCATLRGDQAMSTLFGHIKGAFTGALKSRKGLLLEADQGLLFLDEIGELGLDEQSMLLRAIEDKVFMPFGSDNTVFSDFQLIAGTNQDLFKQVQAGKFREDLLARINLWTYCLPALKDRREDIIPNINYELERVTQGLGHKVSFNTAAQSQYIDFALSEQAIWRANFRDLSSSMTRMATLAEGGRITESVVKNEIKRLSHDWQQFQSSSLSTEQESGDYAYLCQILGAEKVADIDVFDQAQLAQVIRVCRASKNMAEAGRRLFNVSRTQRTTQNDSHRVRQYLKKFELSFSQL